MSTGRIRSLWEGNVLKLHIYYQFYDGKNYVSHAPLKFTYPIEIYLFCGSCGEKRKTLWENDDLVFYLEFHFQFCLGLQTKLLHCCMQNFSFCTESDLDSTNCQLPEKQEDQNQKRMKTVAN